MRIGYVTTYDPADRRNWSGLGHAIMHALIDAGAKVEVLGPLTTNWPKLGRLKATYYRRLCGQSYEYERERIPCSGYARQLKSKLAKRECEVLLCPGTIPASRLDCEQPIAIWADATFACYVDHYGFAKSMAPETIRAGHATERAAYARASLLIFASKWAANSAVSDYGVAPAKIAVIPFGANFTHAPSREAVLEKIETRPDDCCELISIGVDWVRKGMPRAVALAAMLNARGLRTRLTIVGCLPPDGVVLPNFVELAGFIDKRTSDGEKRIGALLARSHFHVLFSTAEAFGIVFAEANAFGVPNVASDVGGIESAVTNAGGGQRYDPATNLMVIATHIQDQVCNKRLYRNLARQARYEFENRLNWTVSGKEVLRKLETLLSGGQSC